MTQVIDSENELEDDMKLKLQFLTEQLSLILKPIPSYSNTMLKWAAAIYYAYPGAYKALRETKNLILPHPRYLRKILGKLGNNSPGLTSSNIAFLKEKFKLLGPDDKIVSLLFDEIYVNSTISYKGGKLNGMAEESGNTSDCTAGTLQSFMYSSLKSKNKEIASLVPVRNLDGDILEKLTLQVLKVLKDIGYTVLSLIADDNAVNRKMFENLSGGEGKLKEWIPHPFDKSERLYLLFDTVHLFKNIRNNWLNCPSQIFKIPPVSDFAKFMQDYRESSRSLRSDSDNIAEPSAITLNRVEENHSPDVRMNETFAVDKENCPTFDLSGLQTLEDHWQLENEEEFADLIADFENDPFLNAENQANFTEAKFSDIKALFYAESRLLLKLGYKLNRKSVFPSKIERQNVSLVINVFNDSTILALETLKKDGSMVISEGAIILLCWVVRWWKITNVKRPFKGSRLNDRWCKPIYGPDDEKLKFLRDFLSFLRSWEALKIQGESKGKLTPQTQEALSHTISAQISLCLYVFEKYGWNYILLGKLMTDLIEGRFGGYRRLSGCSYHVSVEQVLESERKLRILGVLKLKSASIGEFSINTFCDEVQAASKDEVEEDLAAFKDAIYEKAAVPVSLNSKRILVILSSYTATKVIKTFQREKRPLCPGCTEFLITDTMLEIERPEEVYEYLSGVDRGGLNKPSHFSFDLCINIYKLFETLVSPTYEQKFLKLRFHRNAIVTLGLKMCNIVLENTETVCPTCETYGEKVIKQFLTTMANILLNNYTKKANDVNTSRQIAVKLSKKALKEQNCNKNKGNNTGKQKDKDARKILKLSSKENF